MPVSVVLPCYNCDQYISDAIQSILDQTYTDFELIIIDDGSTDQSTDIIHSFKDNRLRIVTKNKNKGLVDSLNIGLELSQHKYVAIMHADDIAFPDRLKQQVLFLDSRPDIICCGTWIQILGSDHIIKYPTDPKKVHLRMLEENVLAHPTVMFRKSVIRRNGLRYNDEFYYGTEDYAFWQQLMKAGNIANIPEVLLQYRLHAGQKTELFKQRNIAYTKQVRTHFFTELSPGGNYEHLLDNYAQAVSESFSFAQFSAELNQLKLLKNSNDQKAIYDGPLFNDYIHLKESYLVKAYLVHQFSPTTLWRIILNHPGSLIRTLQRKLVQLVQF